MCLTISTKDKDLREYLTATKQEFTADDRLFNSKRIK